MFLYVNVLLLLLAVLIRKKSKITLIVLYSSTLLLPPSLSLPPSSPYTQLVPPRELECEVERLVVGKFALEHSDKTYRGRKASRPR